MISIASLSVFSAPVAPSGASAIPAEPRRASDSPRPAKASGGGQAGAAPLSLPPANLPRGSLLDRAV